MALGAPLYINPGSLGDPTQDFYGITTTGGTWASSTVRARSPHGRSILGTRTSNADCSCRWYSGSTGMPSYMSGVNQATVFAWFSVAALPASGNTPHIMEVGVLNGAPWDVYLDLDSSGNLTLFYGSTRSSVFGTVSTANVWHLVEVQIDVSTGTHSYTAKLDGGTPVTSTVADTATTMLGGILGPGSGSVAGTWTIYFQEFGIVNGLGWLSASGATPTVYDLIPDGGASDLDTSWSITGGSANRMAATNQLPPDGSTTYISTTGTVAQRLALVKPPTVSIASADVVYGIQWFGSVGSNTTTTGPQITVTGQDWGGVNSATSFVWPCNVNGWQRTNVVSVDPNPPSGDTWMNAINNGYRLRLSPSGGATGPVRCTAAYGWLLVSVAPVTFSRAVVRQGASYPVVRSRSR